MIFPFAVDLRKVMKQPLPMEGELLEQCDRRFVVRHDICLDPVKAVFAAYERNQKRKRFGHVPLLQMILVGLVAKHTA